MMKRIGMLCLLAFATLAFCAGQEPPAPAEEAHAPAEKGEAAPAARELSVTADNMTFSMDRHLIELEGNVLVENGEMMLTAKKMQVHLDERNKLKSIEAVGPVRVQQVSTANSATGDTGYYDAATQLVTLRGNCVMMQGNNVMKGQTVQYDVKKQSFLVQRPTISLHLGKDEDEDGGDGEGKAPSVLDKFLK